jgi:uncharacterized membrane protein (DUF2068 family)
LHEILRVRALYLMRVRSVDDRADELETISILDVLPGARPFESEPIGRQSVIVYFAVIDAMAAVGLWLTSAWGGVVWLLAATSALTLAVLTPQLLPMTIPYLAAQAGIIALYFILSFLAARESR